MGLALWTYDLCRDTGPCVFHCALPSSMLYSCHLEILINFGQVPMFSLCIDPTIYVDSPAYQPSEDNNTCLTICLKLPCLGPIKEPDIQNSELLL